jgi:hypothetical protein
MLLDDNMMYLRESNANTAWQLVASTNRFAPSSVESELHLWLPLVAPP